MFEITYRISENVPPPMPWEEYEKLVKDEYQRLLSSPDSRNERKIQSFLESHPCMLPGPFGLLGASGHYPFPGAAIAQPVLPGLTCKKPDFLWIATDSAFVYPVLIEIETPFKRWFTKNGKPDDHLTQAIDQLTDWKTWFATPENMGVFVRDYDLPAHLGHRTIKPLYVLIYGRREEATRSASLSRKRGQLPRADEFYMTFDRLTPDRKARDLFCVNITSKGYEAIIVPPTTRLGPALANFRSVIANKENAAGNSPYLDAERKRFLMQRFAYWDEWARVGSNSVRSGDWE